MIHNISRFIAALALLATAQGAWAWDGNGTKSDPYQIKSTADLDQLATNVNGGNDYSGKYFVLTADITYDHTGLGDTESNYTAIGGYYDRSRYFLGTFDGQNHVVSGIRIYKGGNAKADQYQGLFGQIGSQAEVKSVILADARITGYDHTGAIVGYISSGGTVIDCHALATVTVHAVQSLVYYHGGIAGINYGTVTRCTSAATLTTAGSGSYFVGGIAGYNGGTVTDCIYLGTTLDGANYVGAIAGYNERTGTVETSYFTDTAIQGKDKDGNTLGNAASAVGINNGGKVTDVRLATSDDFAVSGDTYTIGTAAGWSVMCAALYHNDKGYFSGKTVNLAADITVTRMAGGQPFTGTFDGQNHTLTLDYGTADAPVDAQFVAPFVETAADGDHQPTFRNLTIGGTIYEGYTGSEAHNVGGLIGHLFGTVTIEQCTSNVSINATSGAGGFVGLCEHSVSFNDCHSVAVVRSAGGNNGGFVAWSRSSAWEINFTGCLFDGKLLQQNGSGNSNGGFIGWKGDAKTVTITNSLCAPAPLADGETMASSNSATFSREHSNYAATIQNCYYTAAFGAAQGKAVRSVTAADDVTIEAVALTGTATQYTVSGITAYSGGGLQRGETLYYGSGNQLSLTLSNSATGAPQGYQYTYTASAGTLSGSTLTMPDQDVTVNVDTETLRSDGQSHDITYIDADGNEQIAQAIALDGHEAVRYDDIILDAGTYYVGTDIAYANRIWLNGDVTLILANGKTMTLDGNTKGIFGVSNNLTIYGQSLDAATAGTLSYNGTSYGIYVSNYEQHSGNVSITTTGSSVYGFSADVTLRGGTLTVSANGDNARAIIGYTHSILGGHLTANSTGTGDYATGIGAYANSGTALTLGWTRPADRITASSISTPNGGTVAVADGQKLHNGSDFLGGTLGDPAAAVNGKTLRPAATATYTTADGTAATADAILLDGSDNSLPAGNYLATGTLNYTHGITLTGNVTLILADNCHMNVGTSGEGRINGKGIAHSGFPTLTITSEANGSGNGNGALNIYTTSSGNYGIITGAITINGGNVTADTDGYNAVALYAADTDLTINGGTVTATVTGSSANAIYAYGNVNYNGGNVTATAPKVYAIRAVGNYTFSWRTPADRITIGATGLYAPDDKTATFARLFTDGSGNYYGATLTGTALNALKGVTLEAAETADFTVTLAPKGYGTYYDGHYDITLPAGTQARIVTARGATDGTLDYETIADGDDGITLPKTVPAGTAVMLCHDGGGTVTLTVHDADIDQRDFTKASGNTPGLVSLLHGSDVAATTTGGTLYYKLTYGSATGHEDIFGWYWGATDGAAFESPAHKAWLALPATSLARSFIGLPDSDDNTTGITTTNDTNDTNSAGAWYTLDGRKLDGTPMKSGIYVNNGKMVIIK